MADVEITFAFEARGIRSLTEAVGVGVARCPGVVSFEVSPPAPRFS